MSLTEQQIEDLQTISRSGQRVWVCEYITVTWDSEDSNETRYYAASKLNQTAPFADIGMDIDARLLNEPFKTFELYPDLRTDTIGLVFDNIDKEISGKFQTFGSGVRVEFFQFYPQVNGHHSLWFGQLQAPEVVGWKQLNVNATNGFRSREQFIPKRQRPRECSWTFGGAVTDEARETNGCKYNPPSIGIGDFADCPKDEAACAARGMTSYFGGYDPDASAVVTSDPQTGYLAVSQGNTSRLKNPIRVIAGTKTVRANQLLHWRRELGASNPDHNWVAGIWEVSEGPNRSVRNIKVGEKLIEQMHLAIRLGRPAQTNIGQYAPDLSNYSNVCHYFARKGWVNALTENPDTMVSECVVEGYEEVTTINDVDAVVRTWTNNRAWWAFELMHNNRFGMSYPLVRFNNESWRNGANWTGQTVTFSYTNVDGEGRSYSHTRSSFDAVIEGRPVAEQIVDICRSGRISVPYQQDGELHIQPFRAFTQDELDDAPTFTDTGSSQNILWKVENNKPVHPLIELSQTPNDKIINEITLVFEDGSNKDNERPITVDNPNQKLLAGRALGENNLQSVPMRFAAFGCRNLNEVIKLGYGLLRFGAFDEGGILNNLRVSLEVPLVEALSVRRYGIIRVVSTLLDGYETPDNDLLSDFTQAEYFRVLSITKTSQNTAQITAQVYNHAAYSAFETGPGVVIGPGDPPPLPPDWPPSPPTPPEPDPVPGPIPFPCQVSLSAAEYDFTNQILLVDIIC